MGTEKAQTSKKETTGLRGIWDRVLGLFQDHSITSTENTNSTTPASIPAEPSAARAPESRPASKSEATTVRPAIIKVDDTISASPVTLDPATHTLPSQPSTAPPDPQDEAQMRFSKAQAIFTRYNLELSEADWGMRPKQSYERVSKTIRMRVRYTCHNCSATFGHDRICAGCQHRRCAQCVRYPPKKSRPRERRTEPSLPPDLHTTAPASSSGRWLCHECQTGFESDMQECPNCHHQICDRCLQEAAITLDQPPDDAVEPPVAGERITATS